MTLELSPALAMEFIIALRQTQLFENYQRSEKALLATICQMVTQGVSTTKDCGPALSGSRLSQVYGESNHPGAGSPDQTLAGRTTAGVDSNGHRKILGADFAFEESYQSYKNHLNRLQKEG